MATSRFITWALACVLLACGGGAAAPAEPERRRELVESTAQQRADEAVLRAMVEWSTAVGWVPAVDAVRFEVPSGDSDRTAAMWDAGPSTLVLVPERIGDDQLHWDTVVMHELGHAYGAGHVLDSGAVMNALPGSSVCVHEADAAELRRVLGAPVTPTCALR